MLDIGWSELLLIGVVALVVVGPKDLPVMFRQLGRITAKARSMAREFSRAMEDAAKEAGVDDVAKDLRNVTSKKSLGLDALEKAADRFEKWDPKLPKKPMGPATQALADARAAKAAAGKDGVGIGTIGQTPASALPEAVPETVAAAPDAGADAPAADPVRRVATLRSRESAAPSAAPADGLPTTAGGEGGAA
ncbi:Sec-independent protein translocase protein TatB [Frigidibacter sp. MR17.14]|uniref:Sec-independent protein translocase protein TatB n=1 Tax=Frigidibacter sp. MR17.14 TaxID=3126509 RepID=UPI003012C2D3